jgi:hypothetical protein
MISMEFGNLRQLTAFQVERSKTHFESASSAIPAKRVGKSKYRIGIPARSTAARSQYASTADVTDVRQ